MKVSIAYINDVHGYLEPHPEIFYPNGSEAIETAGGYARIASVIHALRQNHPSTLVFDGGDTFHGTLPLIETKGEAIVPILNAIGFQAMVGHWDFGYGPRQLQKLAAQLSYPVLGINVYNDDGSLFLRPFQIVEVEDVRIGIIGICSSIVDKTMPRHFSTGLKFTDGSRELPSYIQQLRAEGVHLILLLSHNGFPQDMALLSRIEGIDVCLSAHTHNRLYESVEVNGCVLIQCGCHGSFVGHLLLEIDDGKLTSHSYNLITVDAGIEADEGMENIVSGIMKPYQELTSQVVGRTEGVLHRYDTLESTMDNLLLASIQSATQTQVAFSNGWRYGAPIATGVITMWDLFNIIPMNPPVSTVELTGAEILSMIEENLERTFSNHPLSQMGGYVKRCLNVQVKMRIENPEGHRVQQMFIAGKPLLKDKRYTASFVTDQGVPTGIGINRQELSITAVQAMVDYLTLHSPYTPTITGAFSLV